MNNANISWFVKEPDDIFVEHTEYYAGSCNNEEDLELDIELWNNRWNTKEDVDTIYNAKLSISFAAAEDATLLSFCTVKVGNGSYEKPELITFNRASVELGSISGAKNDGGTNNTENYKNISIRFSGIPRTYKSGLKSMFLDIQYE